MIIISLIRKLLASVNVTGYRYITHLYCLAVQAGFYSDAVECWIFVGRVAGSILSRVRSEEFFFTCYRCVFLCILRWGELTGLLTSVFSQTYLVLGFTTSGIKPKVEFRLSSEFIVTLPISNKKSHSFPICNLPIDFYCVCKNGLCDWSQF